MILQACLNGVRPTFFHPRLPTTPDAIVADAVEAVGAGAHEIHLHVRDEAGAETLSPDAVDRIFAVLRARLPGTSVGISTGDWIEKDDDRRLGMIADWRMVPDYASVNLSERDAPAVFEWLARRGVAVEAGLGSIDDARRLVALGLAARSLRILVELDDAGVSVEAAQRTADTILAVLAEAGISKPLLIHGAGQTVWSFVERAARERYSTRVGLEDGATMPDGTVASSNADLVAAAAALITRSTSLR